MTEQGTLCPPNSRSPKYMAEIQSVQQHGPQQKAQKANAALGFAPLTFQPLNPVMQKVLAAIKTKISIKNPIKIPINNPINNPINSKRRKLENWAENKQIVQDNRTLSATDKMSDGKPENASIFN